MGNKTVHPYYVRATSASVLAYIVWGGVHRVGLGYLLPLPASGFPLDTRAGLPVSIHRHQASCIIYLVHTPGCRNLP